MIQYIEAWYLYTIGLLIAVPAVSMHITIYSSLSDFARVLEGPALHFALLSLGLSILVLLLGMVFLGSFGIFVSVVALIHIYMIIPHAPEPKVAQGKELALLVANIEGRWGSNHRAIFDNIIATDPDIIFIMETDPKLHELLVKSKQYAHELPCLFSQCDNHIFSKYPIIGGERLKLLDIWKSPRFADLTVDLGNDTHLSLLLTHLTKAWIPESDVERTRLLLRALQYDRPLVVAGDFNAAPWSAQMRRFKARSGIYFKSLTPGTWPSEFGAFGIPIDHVGVKGDIQLMSLNPWLGASGSNHRGLLAKLRVKSLVGEK